MSEENKIITRNGVIRNVNNEYIEFTSHKHITGSVLENLKEDAEAFKVLVPEKMPIISFLHRFDKMDSESEKFVRSQLPLYFTKMAVVSQNKWVFFVGKMITQFVSFPIPYKMFSDEEKAMKWIKS